MTALSTYRLTQYVHGGGCACKIPPGELEQVIGGLDPWRSPDLIVGLDTGDDAAVVRIGPGQAMVSTTDFFTAVLDDGYDFGRVAAANALSDIYAMGATPVLALNLVGWPRDTLPLELLGEVLRGGADICRQAQVQLAGGQSIDDPEPKYGMAVTGLVDPDRLLRNDAARSGPAISEEEHEVVLHEEVPVVEKEAVAVERITLGKETVTEQATVSDEVRKENIELVDPTDVKKTSRR